MPDSILLSAIPCAKCGATSRYKSGGCKPCAAISSAAYYVAKREVRLASAATYRAANPEKVKACQKSYRVANSEKIKQKDSAYRAANQDKAKVYQASYYQENRDALIAANAEYQAKNPEVGIQYRKKNKEVLKAKATAWRLANTERVALTAAAWAKANPEARRINQHNRRAKQTQISGTLSRGLSAKLFKLQQGKCPCCKQPLGDDHHMDHKMPLALGGSNTDDNMQLLRATCNMQKYAKHPIDFMQERGFLL